MAVDDWFFEFYEAHTARHPRTNNPQGDWPVLDSEEGKAFFSGLRSLFVLRGVHELEVATLASESLMGTKLWGVADHPKALVDAATEIYKARAAANGGGGNATLDDRESAAFASKGCQHCHGQGMAIVFAGDPEKVRGVTDVSAYCVCQIGRWIERNHREKSADVHKRTPDLVNVLAGRSFWLASPVGVDAPAGQPAKNVAATIRAWTATIGDDRRHAPARPKHPDWMGKVPDALEMPRPLPRAAEIPAPAPVPRGRSFEEVTDAV